MQSTHATRRGFAGSLALLSVLVVSPLRAQVPAPPPAPPAEGAPAAPAATTPVEAAPPAT